MIEVFYWPTPNGHKITLFLEEAGVPYQITRVDISAGAQFDPEFLKIAPNNRMPAIVDHAPAGGGAPVSVFESGAILLYLAEKTGKFLPDDVRDRAMCTQWLFWQMAGLGPMAGQNHHFNVYALEKIPYAIERYVRETTRLYGVLDKRLHGREFICGNLAYPVDCQMGCPDAKLAAWTHAVSRRRFPSFSGYSPMKQRAQKFLEHLRWPHRFTCTKCGNGGDPYRFAKRTSVVLRCRVCQANSTLLSASRHLPTRHSTAVNGFTRQHDWQSTG